MLQGRREGLSPSSAISNLPMPQENDHIKVLNFKVWYKIT